MASRYKISSLAVKYLLLPLNINVLTTDKHPEAIQPVFFVILLYIPFIYPRQLLLLQNCLQNRYHSWHPATV